jgi:integrase
MSSPSDDRPSIRVLLAVGNAERERRLLEGLPGDGLVVADRCLDGPSLAERAGGADLDVALASSDLHRLTASVLTAVREARLPLVLIADGQDVSRYATLAHLIPENADVSDVAAALRAAVRRGPVYSAPAPAAQIEDGGMQGPLVGGDGDGPRGRLIAVVSGKGAPGKTTVAIGLAAALAERGRRVVLVDADLWGGTVGACLDLDPRRGLFALAYGRDASPAEWAARLDEELQEGPGFMVLGGIERAEQRPSISADVVSGAIATLRERFEDVVIDAGCVREALQHALRWQLIGRNPADSVEPPRPLRHEIPALSPDDAQRVLAAAEGTSYDCLVYLALMTGLRQGELLGLRWQDVDLEASVLHVRQTCQWLPREGFIFRQPKTYRGTRPVALSRATVERLRQHRRRQLEGRLAKGPAYKDKDLVFANAMGAPVHPTNLRRAWLAVAREAGLGRLRFHDLRHAHASLLLQQGVHPKIVSERLGHSGVGITLDIYSHVLPSLQAQAADGLDGLLSRGPI